MNIFISYLSVAICLLIRQLEEKYIVNYLILWQSIQCEEEVNAINHPHLLKWYLWFLLLLTSSTDHHSGHFLSRSLIVCILVVDRAETLKAQKHILELTSEEFSRWFIRSSLQNFIDFGPNAVSFYAIQVFPSLAQSPMSGSRKATERIAIDLAENRLCSWPNSQGKRKVEDEEVFHKRHRDTECTPEYLPKFLFDCKCILRSWGKVFINLLVASFISCPLNHLSKNTFGNQYLDIKTFKGNFY